jgi:dihydrofolate reductase
MNFSFYAVSSIDGIIAKDSQHPTDWSSKEDKQFLRESLAASDLVVVGNNTLKITPQLKKYPLVIFTKNEDLLKNSKEDSSYPIYLNPEKKDLAKFAHKRNLQRIAILGGTQVFELCFKRGWFDHLYLTIEPVIFGFGLRLFSSNLQKHFRLRLISLQKLNDSGTILLHLQSQRD